MVPCGIFVVGKPQLPILSEIDRSIRQVGKIDFRADAL